MPTVNSEHRRSELFRENSAPDSDFVVGSNAETRSESWHGDGGLILGSLEDLDDLRGYLAAEANHTKDKKLEKRLDALWAKLTAIMESYDDGGWG